MNNIKVSVIVPIYNSEQYVERCIDSLINQTLLDIEILAINDGSTDKSLEILKKIQNRDNRVKIINQQNLGVSAARNNGIKESRGHYLSFVDSDDYIDPDMLWKMYNVAIQDNSDIVACGCVINNPKKTQRSNLNFNKTFNLDADPYSFLKNIYLSKEFRTSSWNKLYKASIIKNKNVFISYNQVISEDTLFNFCTLLESKQISVIPDCLYNYEVRENSLSNSKRYEQVTERNASMILYMSEYVSRKNNKWAKDLLCYYYLQSLSIIAELEINYNNSSKKELFLNIKKYINMVNGSLFNNKTDEKGLLSLVDSKKKAFYYLLYNFAKRNNIFILISILLFKTELSKRRK
jgi:glycosyltransferase involved in cell wall biosynthesis